ncbi:insulin receptor substrate 1-like [Platichthys flesus]|uniref:insulin receptor substrate 1-like n=1 Tax=Platichthys flesus TaxID=8260 RepID=UPI002DC03A4F|nr:insulin receptor substrate 1-like [Platichthys flesus]XP_062237021.1 insulin receptor substrate 1-like [Platichthys flesus]XP_062237022.1 insulin receptor substrate 1-like [Platichthys flesus]XP_062237023.1 insulin receptor substrate 1-like [Platichthys flesus]
MADGWDNPGTSLPASSSPVSSPSCKSTQTWPPVESPLRPLWLRDPMEQEDASGHHRVEVQTRERPSSCVSEEPFCPSQGAVPVAPLAGAIMASSWPQVDVVKQGYLGKLERNRRRYFVLRAGSDTGPSRLEWYKSREKFTAGRKSAGKAALFGLSKQGVIYLRCCLGVSRIGSSKKGHMVALYAKDQTMVLVVEDQQEQEEWYVAIKKLIEGEQKDEEHGGGIDEDDDGYFSLPPAAFFKEVWPVSVKPRGLGRSLSLGGEMRLCLTATSLILVKLGANSHLPTVTIPLLSVRRFGHLDGSFYLELGRSAPGGPGEIWMEAGDQGNPGTAQHIHELVRETVHALRALPDFSQSPTSNQHQALLLSNRSRYKYRDKAMNMRPLTLALRNTDMHTSPTRSYIEPGKPNATKPESTLSLASLLSPVGSQRSSVPETGSYMEMKTRRLESWELEEEEEEKDKGPDYMMMSPQVSRSSYVFDQDDYVSLESPHKDNRPPDSSPSSGLCTSFSSSTSDDYSPMRPSRPQTNELTQKTDAGQSQMSISFSTRPAGEQQRAPQRRRHPAQTGATSSSSLLRSVDRPHSMKSPVQASPNSDLGQSSPFQAAPDQSAFRRYRLSSCLMSCLQSEDRS